MLRVKKNLTTCGCNLIVLSAKLASTIQIMVMKVFKPREKFELQYVFMIYKGFSELHFCYFHLFLFLTTERKI